jgi:hypothetical protein
VTIFPVPKLPPGHCRERSDGSAAAIVARAWETLVGGGLDMNGVIMCGQGFKILENQLVGSPPRTQTRFPPN